MAQGEYNVLLKMLSDIQKQNADITKQNNDQLVRLARLEDSVAALKENQESFVPRPEILSMRDKTYDRIEAMAHSISEVGRKLDENNSKKEIADNKATEKQERRTERILNFRYSLLIVIIGGTLSTVLGLLANNFFHFFH